MSKPAIIIFIKNPELGKVKKRLAKAIGDNNALDIYNQMLRHTRQITKTLNTDKFLFYDKSITTADQWPEDVYQKELQNGPTMAQRISNAFKLVFSKGYNDVITIGSDCLELDERLIRLAFRQLQNVDTVVGPTTDGGLYLLGMKTYHPQLLQVEGWGTAALNSNMNKAIQQLHLSNFMLSEMHSVGTVEDLNEDLKTFIK
jgi:rSAM/selenodomain-associated transferase 1